MTNNSKKVLLDFEVEKKIKYRWNFKQMFHRSPMEMFFRFKAIGARLADFQKLKIGSMGKEKFAKWIYQPLIRNLSMLIKHIYRFS